MNNGKPDSSDRRSVFQRLIKRREKSEHERHVQQRQSLEGLRLSALMKQMQALQAIQGFQELAPHAKGSDTRHEIATNKEERARQRQWLEYKADWMQALLEDTLTQLEAMDQFEVDLPEGEKTGAGLAGAPPQGKPER
ncbi:MAG: hypothetical protein Q8R92_16395 [Deltaproteobacteria bacterium]|nr:hypothetical protein [Deltaproteobacteria bacterium]